MQLLRTRASARAPAAAAAAAGARPAAISPPRTAAAAAAAPSRRRPLLANYSSGGSGGGGGGPAGPAPPTVSLRLGSAADAATVSLPLPPTAAKRLDAGLRALHATLRAKQEAAEGGERPRRWPVMEFAFPSDEDAAEGAALTFQLYCNPNAHSSAFDAKVLVRVECGGGGDGAAAAAAAAASAVVRMTGEARLTDVQGTLEVYWDELKAKQEQ